MYELDDFGNKGAWNTVKKIGNNIKRIGNQIISL